MSRPRPTKRMFADLQHGQRMLIYRVSEENEKLKHEEIRALNRIFGLHSAPGTLTLTLNLLDNP